MLRRGKASVVPTFLVVVAALVTTAIAFAGCDDAETPHACSSIPAGGCPRSHGVACQDPSCEAVYLCRPNNVWELEQRCPARDASSTEPPSELDAATDAGDASSSPPSDASIDAPPGAFGGPGCATLQAPDCTLGVALACGGGCCGCEDLFVCENQGWTLWGACGPTGVVKTP